MKLGDLKTLSKQDYSEYIKMALNQDSAMNALKTKFNNGALNLKPLKIVGGENWVLCLPIEMAVPFNPFDLDDETYDVKNPFILPGTFSYATGLLKKTANENEELANRIASLLDVEKSKLNLNSDTLDSSDEICMWHKWARLSYITHYTQKVQIDPSQQYPRKVGFDPILDAEGEVVGSNGVGFELYSLETDLIRILIQMETDKFKEGGERANEPKSTLEKENKERWEERIIRNPYLESYLRVCAFKLDNAAEGALDSKEVEKFNKSKNVADFLYTLKVTKEDINSYETAFASKKSDIHADFIEIQLQIPPEDPNNKLIIYTKQNKNTINSLNTAFSLDEDPKTHINPSLFEESWTTLFSNTDRINNEALRKSIFAFRMVSDDVLVKAIKDNITRYESALQSSIILDKYSDAVSLIGEHLTAQIASKIMDGEDNCTDISAEIINTSIDDETSDYRDTLGENLANLMNGEVTDESENTTNKFDEDADISDELSNLLNE